MLCQAAGVQVPQARELLIREAAMNYLGRLADRAGGVVTRAELEAFTFEGEQIKLIDQSRGIRNPRQLTATLSILSSPRGPYGDEPTEDGLIAYDYRTGPADAGDNIKLRRAAALGLPVILLRAVAPAVFVPVFPVYLVDDSPLERHVKVALDESLRLVHGGDATDQRSYAERILRQRLHQPVFRAAVLTAYQRQCSICRLKHVTLLDAAHVLSDSLGGQPVVPNGLALCKIHHAAFDADILAIRPDYTVEVRESVLREVDGPMLLHGIQETHGWSIQVPAATADRPDRDLLAKRYQAFRDAS